MKTIKDWKYTSRSDYSADIRDVLELVQYLHTLEQRVDDLEARQRGKDFMKKIDLEE